MEMSLSEVIEKIGYSRVVIYSSTPLEESNIEMVITHISESDDRYYIEDANGNSRWLKKDLTFTYQDGEYYIEKSNCHICIKLSV